MCISITPQQLLGLHVLTLVKTDSVTLALLMTAHVFCFRIDPPSSAKLSLWYRGLGTRTAPCGSRDSSGRCSHSCSRNSTHNSTRRCCRCETPTRQHAARRPHNKSQDQFGTEPRPHCRRGCQIPLLIKIVLFLFIYTVSFFGLGDVFPQTPLCVLRCLHTQTRRRWGDWALPHHPIRIKSLGTRTAPCGSRDSTGRSSHSGPRNSTHKSTRRSCRRETPTRQHAVTNTHYWI